MRSRGKLFEAYVALVQDEPIPGVPSIRLYGPFESRDAALGALEAAGLRDHAEIKTGVLPLRNPVSMPEER